MPRLSRTAVFSLFVGSTLVWNALGEVTAPGALREPASLSNPAPTARTSAAKKPKSALRQLRPVARDSEDLDFDEAERVLSIHRPTIEKIYDKDMEQRFRERYQGEVAPHEKAMNNPYRPARSWEVERYDQSRQGMAKWAAKEVMNDQLKEFLRGSDKNAAPVKVLNTMKELSGGDAPVEKPLTTEEKIARAHRRDLPVSDAEEKVPTRLKAKLNVVHGRGQLTFTNPVVTTSLAAKTGSGDDNFAVEMNREFKKLSLDSRLRYGIDREQLNLNVNKRITDQVSLNLDSEHHTGKKRGASGEKSRETAKVIYSISF